MNSMNKIVFKNKIMAWKKKYLKNSNINSNFEKLKNKIKKYY